MEEIVLNVNSSIAKKRDLFGIVAIGFLIIFSLFEVSPLERNIGYVLFACLVGSMLYSSRRKFNISRISIDKEDIRISYVNFFTLNFNTEILSKALIVKITSSDQLAPRDIIIETKDSSHEIPISKNKGREGSSLNFIPRKEDLFYGKDDLEFEKVAKLTKGLLQSLEKMGYPVES